MLRVLFTGNFSGATIFDLPLSSEDFVTFLWFGCPETKSLERKNPGGHPRLVSSPFSSLIAMNSSLIYVDFHF